MNDKQQFPNPMCEANKSWTIRQRLDKKWGSDLGRRKRGEEGGRENNIVQGQKEFDNILKVQNAIRF